MQNLKNGGGGSSAENHSPRIVTGFLLRSIVLSEFPVLKIQGFDQNKNALSLSRMDSLSESVLLCLFEGEVQTVEISLGAEILHFGLKDSSLDSTQKSLNSSERKISLKTCAWKHQSRKIIDITESLKQLEINHLDASSFALRMVASSPKIIFKLLV